MIYCNTINSLVNDLSQVDLKSHGFISLRNYLTNYANSDGFLALIAETKKLKDAFSSVKYSVIINGLTVKVRQYEEETDYSAEVEQTFEKFKQGPVKDYRSKLPEESAMNEVEARILYYVAKLHPDIFTNMDNFYAQHLHFIDETISIFDREIQFYVAYLEFVAQFKQAGLK